MQALEDANSCIKTKPDWPKGYGRKGAALHKLQVGAGPLRVLVDRWLSDPSRRRAAPSPYFRAGSSLTRPSSRRSQMFEPALEAYEEGLKVKPNDPALTAGRNGVVKDLQASRRRVPSRWWPCGRAALGGAPLATPGS